MIISLAEYWCKKAESMLDKLHMILSKNIQTLPIRLDNRRGLQEEFVFGLVERYGSGATMHSRSSNWIVPVENS